MQINAFLTDLQGNQIAELLNEPINQGNYSFSYNVSNLPQGVYCIYFEFESSYLVKRINIVK